MNRDVPTQWLTIAARVEAAYSSYRASYGRVDMPPSAPYLTVHERLGALPLQANRMARHLVRNAIFRAVAEGR